MWADIVEMDDNEKFWVGSNWCEKDVVVNCNQTSDGKRFLSTNTDLRLDPDYSDWSVRIYDPKSRSLSWVLCTLAIIPKSLIKQVHGLLGEYLGVEQKAINLNRKRGMKDGS